MRSASHQPLCGCEAYEREFNGKDKPPPTDSPSPPLRCAAIRAVGELGLQYKPSPNVPLTLDLRQGYTGKRDGITGSLQISTNYACCAIAFLCFCQHGRSTVCRCVLCVLQLLRCPRPYGPEGNVLLYGSLLGREKYSSQRCESGRMMPRAGSMLMTGNILMSHMAAALLPQR